MSDNTLIVGLSIAILLLVGLIVFGVGRYVYYSTKYYRLQRQPTREIHHPEFGVLVGSEFFWGGNKWVHGREISFTIGGDKSGPKQYLLARLKDILDNFDDVERRALDFLRSHEPEALGPTLGFYQIIILDRAESNDFILEFYDDRYDMGVWGVEFFAGKPKKLQFDD